jgi:hypothetical protein
VNAQELFEKAAALAAPLPNAVVERNGKHASFKADGKTFAWFLDDHHGDGIVCVCVKVDPEEKEMLLELDPKRYLRPAYVSRFGWLSLRLDLGRVDWKEIGERLRESYRIAAPRKLVKQLDGVENGRAGRTLKRRAGSARRARRG